jgi:hypothetical protein
MNENVAHMAVLEGVHKSLIGRSEVGRSVLTHRR